MLSGLDNSVECAYNEIRNNSESGGIEMSRNRAENSKKKSVIIAASVFLAAAVIFTSLGFISKKNRNSEKSRTSHSVSVSVNSSSNNQNNTAEAPQAISTTENRKDGSSLPEGTKSEFIKGAEAVNRWTATSVISSVTVERVKVNLNVYEKNEKTDEVRTRYMYVAKAETRPSRINMISAGQVTSDRIAGIPAIIDGIKNLKDEDVLFACSNELCASDGTNPNRNIYYTSKNGLEATVVKDGVLAQQGKSSTSVAIYDNGKWEYPVRVSLSNSAQLIKFGLKNSVAYTYPIIWDGKKWENETEIYYDIWKDRKIAPAGDVSCDRTLIGKIDDNNYVFLISEGFSGAYLIDYMIKDMGARYAYWGTCGYATGMYVKGYGVITSNNYVAHGDLFCIK